MTSTTHLSKWQRAALIMSSPVMAFALASCASSKSSATLPASTTQPPPARTTAAADGTTTADSCLGTPDGSAPEGEHLTPAQLRTFAGLNKIENCGAGQTVAVVISPQGSDITQDLRVYSKAYGLPAPDPAHFEIVAPTGQCNRAQGQTPIEAHIDVEMVHATAPQAKIIVACPGSSDVEARAAAITAAIESGATVVSMSWGQPETPADIAALEPVFKSHPEVTFFAGSGDSGANLDTNGQPRVAYPAASSYVVAVGATVETGANELSSWPKSGGGISKLIARPSYQNGISGFAGSGRLVPDITMNGAQTSAVSLYGAHGWTSGTGTSVAAPLAAGWMAIANAIHGGPIGDIHAKLYGTLNDASWKNIFRDVTSGNDGLYTAQPGYDLLGGLGSPRADLLIPLLTSP